MIIVKSKEEMLKDTLRKVIGGFQLVFVCFSIGIIAKAVTNWEWVDILIKFCIFGFTAILIVIKHKMDKKHNKEEYEKKRGEK